MTSTNTKKYVAIIGPTASGKSALAMELAEHVPIEIVVCDSVQVYRGFNLGSAKPDAADQAKVPHHMIDLLDWNGEFSAAGFAKIAKAKIAEIRGRGRLPVLVAGTGLYLRALWGDRFDEALPRDMALRQRLAEKSDADLYLLLKRLDPARAAKINPNDRYRVGRALEIRLLLKKPVHEVQGFSQSEENQAFVIYLNPERETLRERIALRTKQMIDSGLLDEVKALLDQGCPTTAKPMQSIGYRQSCDYLQNPLEKPDLFSEIYKSTCQYAKRQRTWFKKVPANLVLHEPRVRIEDRRLIIQATL